MPGPRPKARPARGPPFPGAIILRPSIVFGPEDSFFNRFAGLAPLLAGPAADRRRGNEVRSGLRRRRGRGGGAAGRQRARPDGKTYELGGPEVLTFKQLMQFTLDTIERKRLLIPLPWGVATPPGA